MGGVGRLGLTVLVIFVGKMMLGAEARAMERAGPSAELFITSSIPLNKPMFEDTAGPFTVGQELTITCSTQDSPGVLLSWWEGGSQLSAVLQEGEGISSVSVTVGALALEDSGRHFTCRRKGSEITKSIKLEVQQVQNGIKEILQVLLNGLTLDDVDPINIKVDGDVSLNCVNQGYEPSAVSWWEGDAELESVASKSPYATNSVLRLKALTVDDSGRSFTCRSLNGQLSKTVTLNVNVTEERIQFGGMAYKLITFSVVALVIILLALVIVVDLQMMNRAQAKKYGGTDVIKKMAAVEQGSINIMIGAVRGKITGKQNNFSTLINEEDSDDSPVEVIQEADAS